MSPDPLLAVDLRVERRADPIGVDEPHPVFSWVLSGSGRGRRQSAYRVRVVAVDPAGAPAADPRDEALPAAWDTGTVAGAASVDVEYAGEPLRPRTAYRFAVRVTDEAGTPGPWSVPASFETGLGAGGFAAPWVGAPVAGAPPLALDEARVVNPLRRIWLPRAAAGEPAPRAGLRARRGFTLPASARLVGARLAVAGPAATRAWLNGIEVTAAGDDAVVAALAVGENVLAVESRLAAGEEPGVLARLSIGLAGAPTVEVATSGAWRCAPADGPTTDGPATGTGWTEPGFVDAGWPLAEAYGRNGDPPRGHEPATLRPVPYLRREFGLSAPVRRARLYATALGGYELRLNGARVGADYFAPGWTDYRVRVPYQTYDVTGLLRAGENVLAGLLADGWYAGLVGWYGPFHYGRQPLLAARLEVEHDDGTRTVVTTDGEWRRGTGAIRYADFQNGCVLDARAEPTGWDRPGFDAASWAPVDVVRPACGAVEAAVAPPIRVCHELPARSVRRTADGRYIVDFGQNLVGWVRARLTGPAGTRVILRHAEVLDETGELYTTALRSALCTDELILAGDPAGETLEPAFTWRGFRYAEVIGYPGELAPADLTARVVHAAMEQIGEFSCSDPRLDQLQSNIVWGQRGNFLAVPTDCPQRDERLGWTGDAQAFAATAAFNYDVRGFLGKWLQDLRDDQHADGSVPHVVPDVMSMGDGSREHTSGAAGWGDAIVVVPARLLEAYADRRSVAATLAGIDRWLAYLEADSPGLIRPVREFGDWLAITPTPHDLIGTAFVAYAARLSAELADQLGDGTRAGRYRDLFGRVRRAFRDRYVGGGGQVGPNTQTALVLALHAGLLDPAEEPRAAARLVADIASRNGHLATGFLGTPYLLEELTRTGHADVAWQLMVQDSYPSWLYPVVHGDATTMWERWDSWSDSRGFQDPGMTSFNHYAYGAVGEWMYRTIGGLAPARPGYQVVRVAPRPGGGVTSARCALATPHGRVATSWRAGADGFELAVSVPPGASAEVHLAGPAGAVTEGGRPLAELVAAGEAVVADGGPGPGGGTDGEARGGAAGGRLVVTVGSGDYAFHAPSAPA